MATTIAQAPPVLESRTSSFGGSDEKTEFNNKQEGAFTTEEDASFDDVKVYDITSGEPIPDDDTRGLPEETHQLTVRAVVIGCALGSVVQASNLYLGLKTGFTFGPQLFGAILGFAILKPLSRVAPVWFGGGYFGEKENVTVQTAATAAGGLGIIYVSGIPAMYRLGLLSATPEADFGRLIGFTFSLAFFGMCFAIPLRKWYILKAKLVFPTPTATAVTIRSLHSGTVGAAAAKLKAKALGISFACSIALRVASEYAPGILWDWHPFWWLYTFGWKSVLAADNWGFYWEWTPAFLGAGVLTGVNASLSLYAGGIFCWGIVGPILMAQGATVARDFTEDYNGAPVINYTAMSFKDATGLVSPRYWMLFPGVLLMLVGSFVEIFCMAPVIGRAFKDLYKQSVNSISVRRGGVEKYEIAPGATDPAKKEDQVPLWVWLPMLFVMCVITCAVCGRLFGMNVGLTILSLILGFLFSFIGVQCSGSTDINPISTCAKASQLVIGGVTHGTQQWTTTTATGTVVQSGAQSINLLAALISGGAAAQATDMTGDLRTGHLLKCKPRNQFVAQAAGALCSVFLSTGLYILFNKAYPCIIDTSIDTCAFGAPSISAWVAVAQATTSTSGLPLPRGSGIFALVISAIGGLIIVAKACAPPKYRMYFPNVVAFGLAFVLPPGQQMYGLAMAVTSVAAHFWKKRYPKAYDTYAFALAAGGMAGEGLGGVVNAIFVIAGIDGSIYGSSLGCPGNVYCG